MSPLVPAKKTDLIPLAIAVTLVNYSRDYIGRLAREGKIVSEQIDKQWYVSRESLLNFFEQSALEDSVKKRILSQSRKNDLEVRDFYETKISSIKARQATLQTASLAMAVMIMSGGLIGGIFIQNIIDRTVYSGASVDQVFALVTKSSQSASSIIAADISVFSNAQTIAVTEKFPMEKGIVLFPTMSNVDEKSVETLFSDEVTVVITSTTTGFVRSNETGQELPFVRVPDATP